MLEEDRAGAKLQQAVAQETVDELEPGEWFEWYVHENTIPCGIHGELFCLQCWRAETREAKDTASGWAEVAENITTMYHNLFPEEPNEMENEEINWTPPAQKSLE